MGDGVQASNPTIYEKVPLQRKALHLMYKILIPILKEILTIHITAVIILPGAIVWIARPGPGVSFSASVNAGSSSYNSYVPDNAYQNYSNQLSSSIAWSKTWKDKPFNLTITANHNQNTNLKIINVNLPDVGFNVQTIYPFRKKDFVGTPKWYENIGIAYNGNAKSLFSFYDTLPHIFRQIADTFQFGAHHSFPISLSLPQMGVFQVGAFR